MMGLFTTTLFVLAIQLCPAVLAAPGNARVAEYNETSSQRNVSVNDDTAENTEVTLPPWGPQLHENSEIYRKKKLIPQVVIRELANPLEKINYNSGKGPLDHTSDNDKSYELQASSGVDCPTYTVELTSEYGEIYSPGFQGNYPNYASCTWRITLQQGQRIRLDLQILSTEEDYDILEIWDGSSLENSQIIGRFSGSVPRREIMTSGPTAFIKFTSDCKFNDQGFIISYSSLGNPAPYSGQGGYPAPSPGQGGNPAPYPGQGGNPAPSPGVTPGSCGQRPVYGDSLETVIGGNEAIPNSWPWMVPFLTDGTDQFCGGSIISKRYILSAAHCFYHENGTYMYPNTPVYIRAGAHDHSVGTLYGISSVASYLPFTLEMDIALVKLSRDLEFNLAVSPICLPDAEPPVGQSCYATGWGVTSFPDGEASQVLKEVKMEVRDRSYCDDLTSTQLCVGRDTMYNGVESGDSGGPLACENNGRYVISGIASYVDENKEAPDVFLNVASFKDFITNHMN